MTGNTSSRFDRLTTVVLVLAAAVVAGITLLTRLSPPAAAGQQKPRTEQVKGWEKIRDSVAVSIEAPARLQQIERSFGVLPSGQRFKITPIEITTFTDFECPSCQRLDSSTAILASKWILVRNIVHFPVRGENARNAARAFECADREGQGREMHRALYRGQRDFGKRPWTSYALEAFVDDTVAFLKCMKDAAIDARINAGAKLAERLKVTVIPTAVVNGWIVSPSTPERVDTAVANIVARKNP